MKFWCEACKGQGKVWNEKWNYCDCVVCDGDGYTEDETIDNKIRIGKGVIEALESHTSISLQYTYDFVTSETIEQLLILADAELTEILHLAEIGRVTELERNPNEQT